MTRLEASHRLSVHLVAINAMPAAAAIRELWEIVFKTGGVEVSRTLVELRPIIEAHLVLLDLGSKGNAYGNTLSRDNALALRWVLAQAEASA